MCQQVEDIRVLWMVRTTPPWNCTSLFMIEFEASCYPPHDELVCVDLYGMVELR